MVDGGSSAARGFLYQYIRTLEALLDAVEGGQGDAIYVEGRQELGRNGGAETIDYEIADSSDATLVAVQVKSRMQDGTFGPSELFRTVCALIQERGAGEYQLIVNATLKKSSQDLVSTLNARYEVAELRQRIAAILADVGAPKAQERLRSLSQEELKRLRRAIVVVDHREDLEIHESLRARLRSCRNQHREGLGDESAGLMVGYLISEVFRGAADRGRARISISDFRSKLLVDGATLRSALGKRDWGVVIGPVPGWPDVHRREIIQQVTGALPFKKSDPRVDRCVLTGLSGIGKSSLAAAYVMDRADLYDVIIWVDAENIAGIHSSFMRAFAYLAGGKVDLATSVAELRADVLDALSAASGRWLMVFDNCANMREIEPWVPKAGRGHVVFTTTNSIASSRSTTIDIGPMALNEAISLLGMRLNIEVHDPAETKILEHLAKSLECWPLALELASSYMAAGGIGIDGIPNYIATLRVRSLGYRPAIPETYPRTLVEAIYLCLERIEERAQYANDTAASVTSAAIWLSAYLSTRRIPAHLLVVAAMTDPESAGGFTDQNPCHVPPYVCAAPEVVGNLRSESLVVLDEPLPEEGFTKPDVSVVTVSMNSVLQEVFRAQFDRDHQQVSDLIDRLAYHSNLWLAASQNHQDYARALVFAAQAASVDAHAMRLGIESDYVAAMRGNLALVAWRRGERSKAVELLRSEILRFSHRSETHCVLLCCQARIELANIFAEEEPPNCGEVIEHLGHAYPTVQSLAIDGPELATILTLTMRAVLSHIVLENWDLDESTSRALVQLREAVDDLSERLPPTEVSAAQMLTQQAGEALRDGDCDTTLALSRKILKEFSDSTGKRGEIREIRRHAQRLVVEALVELHQWTAARREFSIFQEMAEPADLCIGIREQLIHNAGRSTALAWLCNIGDRVEVANLLKAFTDTEYSGPIAAALSGVTEARIRLLVAVSALSEGNGELAREHLRMANAGLPPHFGKSARDVSWGVIRDLLTALLSSRRAGDQIPAIPVSGAGPRSSISSRDESKAKQEFRRFTAPELLKKGLPGPPGIWIRRPRLGEAGVVASLLEGADDALDPTVYSAIEGGRLSSMLTSLFDEEPVEEIAKKLVAGGAEIMISGFVVVLVAVSSEDKPVGAIQIAPPFDLLSEIKMPHSSNEEKRSAAMVIRKLTGVSVSPAYRGRGIGRSLVTYASDLCWRGGVRLLYGQYDAKSGQSRFFDACGFEVSKNASGIILRPYGLNVGIKPLGGKRFFVGYSDELE